MTRLATRAGQAKDLLGSVNELARLAKEAAETAAAERIKAQAQAVSCTAGMVGCVGLPLLQPPPAVASISNPSIHVHVVPNSK